MKIKRIGWTSFLISGEEVSLLTDPDKLKETEIAFPKTSTDIVVSTGINEDPKKGLLADSDLEKKVVPDSRDKVFEIYTPGEYEIGGLMIRRDIGTDFYLIDDVNVRAAYLGGIDSSFDIEKAKDLGDVDVLIIPVGNGDNFLSFEKLEKLINYVDPEILLPCAYKEDSPKNYEGLKSKDEFVKHFGFANVRDENYLNITPSKTEEDQKSVEVVFL